MDSSDLYLDQRINQKLIIINRTTSDPQKIYKNIWRQQSHIPKKIFENENAPEKNLNEKVFKNIFSKSSESLQFCEIKSRSRLYFFKKFPEIFKELVKSLKMIICHIL